MTQWRVLTIFAIPALVAQEAQQGSVTGFVSDASHAIMPDVEVVVTNKGTNLSRRTQTGNAGLYTFVGLDAGAYSVRAAASGFKTQEWPEIQLDTGASLRVDFTMEIGAAAGSR